MEGAGGGAEVGIAGIDGDVISPEGAGGGGADPPAAGAGGTGEAVVGEGANAAGVGAARAWLPLGVEPRASNLAESAVTFASKLSVISAN